MTDSMSGGTDAELHGAAHEEAPHEEIAQAFAHPEHRAAATAASAAGGVVPPDRISLRDHVVEADIGAFQLERGQRQRLRFNLVVELRPAAPHADDVDRILSYDRLTEAVVWALAVERLNLLETLAERVAARLLAQPLALRVFVRIEKLDRGPFALGVEIVRSRPAEAVAAGDGCGQGAPVVAHLANAAIAAPDLAARLDRLAAEGRAVLLTVGLPDLPRPKTGEAATQRRIDLLAIEQNAWALAARDPRCLVVATRTEIDWALRQGRIIVWAPSKLVLDAVEAPTVPLADGAGLALWLARQLGAARLEIHGAALPAAGNMGTAAPLPIRAVPL